MLVFHKYLILTEMWSVLQPSFFLSNRQSHMILDEKSLPKCTVTTTIPQVFFLGRTLFNSTYYGLSPNFNSNSNITQI